MQKIIVGSQVVYTEGRRTVFGVVVRVLHDHFVVADRRGDLRRVLKERVEAVDRQLDLR
jgi:hypothetical protein